MRIGVGVGLVGIGLDGKTLAVVLVIKLIGVIKRRNVGIGLIAAGARLKLLGPILGLCFQIIGPEVMKLICCNR